MKSRNRFFVAALVAAVSVTSLGACKSSTPYAAKVNGVVLSKKALDAELTAIRDNEDYRAKLEEDIQAPVTGTGNGTFDSAFVAQVLNRRVFYELVHQEVVKRHLTITAQDLATAKRQAKASVDSEVPGAFNKFSKAYIEEIVRSTADVIALQESLGKINDANLRAYYAEHSDEFLSACAAHILVETKAEADSIEKQLKAAKDKAAKFAEIAKAKSKDPGSGANGGDLGCASPAGYVAEFKEAVLKQAVGVIGPPVQTQYGYHIIRVDSRDPKKPFDEMKEQVREALTQNGQSAFSDFLRKASLSAKVDVNPRYGTYDRTGETGRVVPPKAPSGNNSGN